MKNTLVIFQSVLFFLLGSTSAQAGNFENFKASIKEQGFKYATTLNGFATYEKSDVTLSMRDCGGFCCEGIIVAKPISNEQLTIHVLNLYFPLQNTLEWKGRKSVDATRAASRVRILVDEIMNNLSQSNRTEFAFDSLNARGECYPVSEKELKAGKKPALMIKLWIP